MKSCRQCRRLASTRRPEADSFANEPTSLSSSWPGGPTTSLGDEVGERGSRSAGQDVEHRLPNVFIAEYRLVNPMTIHVVLAVRVTVIQAVMILASPSTGLQSSTVLYDVGIATYRCGAMPIS